MRVVVVGAGLGGLAAACHLSGAGHDVTVIEARGLAGGKAGRIERAGFRIDTGPSVLTMPDLLEATFAAAGARMADHVELLPVDPLYRATFAGAEPVYVRRGREAMTAEIEQRCGPADAAAFGPFCDWLEALYAVEQPNFIDRNFDSVLDLGRPVAPALKLLRMGAFGRMAKVVNRRFRDPRLRQLFSFQSLYAGLSPYDALAVYCVITYMDTVGGVWFPRGGIHEVAAGLVAALEKGGTVVRLNTAVSRILRSRGTSGPVTGVEFAGGDHVAADAVVCNADAAVAYRTLLTGTEAPRTAQRGEYSPSCTLWLGGVKGAVPGGAAHHNIHFGGDWKGAFDALLKDGTRQPDPSILVSVPTLSDASLAPAGHHVLYALEPVPNLDGKVDWAAERETARASLLARLEALSYPVGEVVTEQFLDPSDWAAQGMERGTPFSLSHRFFQTGPWRPANLDRRVPGLVLVGGSTVPGVGVPMVLVSGRLAARRVDQIGGR